MSSRCGANVRPPSPRGACHAKLTIIGALLLLTGATVMAKETTRVQNGRNSATVTQSGPSGDAHETVERAPGRSRIEQRNDSNSATIVQDSNPGAAGQDDDDDVMPAPRPRAKADPRGGLDVYGTLRERASSQDRANLDGLMNQPGLSARTR